MVANYEVVRKETKDYANEVCCNLPIEKAVLFGSYEKSTADVLSDVDVAFFIKDFGERTRQEIGL